VLDARSFLRELRTWLERAPKRPTVARAAEGLSVSCRTLQRRLVDHGTTFRREVAEARLSIARARLAHGEEKLASLAVDLGFASHQHFADWFKKHTGESPSEYRGRLRAVRR
jgi:AraC-like DNA-binding protein